MCESTGGYENTLLRACWKVGVRVTRLNPARVRDFAHCRGLLAKTDAIDAKAISEFASTFPPDPTPEPSPQQVLLAELVARREDLKTQRAAESNRSRDIQDKVLRRMLEKHLQFLDAQIKQIDKLIEDTISQDQAMHQKREILVRTKGVGATSAAILLSCLPELGTISGEAISALAGVAPFNRDSGTLRGKRCIRAGRAVARKALYMCALVGSRANPILKDFYQRLISKGKPPKVALTALMRKLVVHLNSSLKILNSQPA